VVINGESQKVSGTAWLDREWSSQFLARTQQGWDWFALRLDDETALVIFQLRATAKSNPNFYSARLMRSDGSGRSIASSDITMSAQAFKTIDQSEYPVSWLIDIPSEKIKLSVNALNDDAKMPLSVSYWEGPIEFDGSHSGVGYMELTGY
jgi:predicted secreted hydrolase